MQRFGYK
jgi:RecJ-like exonuclease